MILGISKKIGVLASIEVKSMFMEEIKTKKYEDGEFDKLRTNIKMGKSQKNSLDGNGLLNHKGRIYVPRVNDLIQKLVRSLMLQVIPFLHV